MASVTVYDGVNISDRSALTKAIKSRLQARSPLKWSVTGDKGTAYGWLSITAPKTPENPCGELDDVRAKKLAQLLRLPKSVHFQGVSIMASHDAYREYLDRAAGKSPSVIATPYWD